MNEFKPGDVVVLKSGGPAMTVESIGRSEDGQPRARCTWFEGGKVASHLFIMAMLEAVER
jgi:uncharacterized protein YodC (DUF2158 family)